MHARIHLDHFQHYTSDLLMLLKVKCDSVTGLPIYGFLVSHSNI